MTARHVLRRVSELGGRTLRQVGSHARVVCGCGRHFTTVPDHGSHDLKPGTLRSLERDLEPCFGPRWLHD